MKTAGFILLQLAALLFALKRIALKKRETESLASLCAMLDQLDGLLGSEALPMPELIAELIRRSDREAAAFLESLAASMGGLGQTSFCALWKQAANTALSRMDSNALQMFEELGAILGRFELETQLRAVGACRTALGSRLEELRQELPQIKRLTLGLSLAASALMGIILI